MRNMMLPLVGSVMLYIACVVVFYISDWLNPSASDAGIGQSQLVGLAMIAVLSSAFLYALYQSIAQNPAWWSVVILQLVLAGVLFGFLMR